MPKPKLCHCGKPMHYKDAAQRVTVESEIRERGPWVTVGDGKGRAWRVPRAYLHTHSILNSDLPTLGFEEIKL